MVNVIRKYIKKRTSKLDEHTFEVLRKSSSSMVVRVCGLIAGFIVSIILGRTIGPEGLGIINLANRIGAIVLVLAMVGMNNVILRDIAIAFEKKDWQQIANTIFTALRINLPLALLFSLIGVLLAPWLVKNIFNDANLKIPLIITLVAIVPQVLSRIFASGINGFRKIWQSNLVNETLSFFVILIGLIILIILKIEITIINVAIIYSIGKVAVTIAVGSYWKYLFKFEGLKQFRGKSMMTVAIPLLLVSATNIISSNADVVMLGFLSNSREVGFYSVAARLGLLTSFFHILTTSSLTPKVASLYGQNKMLELEKMVQKVTQGLGLIGIISVISFILFGKFILSIWGDEFVVAYWPLVIISIGQFFNIATGATGVMLIMTGHEKIVGYISTISVISNIILNVFLIPQYGAVGAALATAITVTSSNILKVIFVYKKLSINTLPF